MNAKEYLSQIEVLQIKIEHKIQRAKELREMALATGGFDYSKEKVQTSPSSGKLENAVIKYLMLEQEITEDLYRLEATKDIITNKIHNVNNAVFIQILYKKYVELKSLGKISKELKYSYQYIRQCHTEALCCFEKKNLL